MDKGKKKKEKQESQEMVLMPKCAVCGLESDNLYKCKLCGESFCEECGDKEDKICLFCEDN